TILISDDRLIYTIIPLNGEWAYRVYLIVYSGVAILLLRFTVQLLPEYAKIKSIQWLTYLYVITGVFVCIAPFEYVVVPKLLYSFLIFAPFFIVPALLFHWTLKGGKHAIYLLLTASSYTSN